MWREASDRLAAEDNDIISGCIRTKVWDHYPGRSHPCGPATPSPSRTMPALRQSAPPSSPVGVARVRTIKRHVHRLLQDLRGLALFSPHPTLPSRGSQTGGDCWGGRGVLGGAAGLPRRIRNPGKAISIVPPFAKHSDG